MTTSLPRRWSLDHNPLSGLTLSRWWNLLRENGFAVDRRYLHRAAFLTAVSAFNSACHLVERVRYDAAVRDVVVRRDPLFIIGHWRSGTTHLHNLLALDDRLATPTTFQVVNPFSFLTTQRLLPRLFAPLLPERRPMDNMALSFHGPQEDELALALLCSLSPYLALSFPKRAAHYERYLTFAGVEPAEVSQWQQTFLHFTRKLSLRDSRRFVFKSPTHTARIRLLLELFPNARFVHIHRDPHEVFQSTRRYMETAAWHANLQPHDPDDFDRAILRRYATLYDAYLEQRSLIPPGRLHELAFASLEADPAGELRRLYAGLDLGDFSQAEPAVRDYLASIAGYERNAHRPLSDDEKQRVAAAWQRYFDAFGYATGCERKQPSPRIKELCS